MISYDLGIFIFNVKKKIILLYSMKFEFENLLASIVY
jgi:hypothetical protein